MDKAFDGTSILKAIIDKMPEEYIYRFGCILVGVAFASYCVKLEHTYKMSLLKAA